MFRKYTISAFLVIVLAFMIVFTGCSKASNEISEKAAEKAVKKETGKDVDIEYEKDKVKIETEDTEAEIEKTTKIPEDFPSDYPVYPGAKLESVIKINEQGEQAYQLFFRCDSSISDVLDYYKKAFPEKGYKIEFSIETPEQASFAVNKGGKNVGGVTITKENEGTLITVVYIEK